MGRNLNAGEWTIALSVTLGAAARRSRSAYRHRASSPCPFRTFWCCPCWSALFLVSELFLMNVEFRRQAHSLTLAGVPLVLGALLLPSHWFIVTRLAGTLIAFIYQRTGLVKSCYNIAAYAFEAAAFSFVLWSRSAATRT